MSTRKQGPTAPVTAQFWIEAIDLAIDLGLHNRAADMLASGKRAWPDRDWSHITTRVLAARSTGTDTEEALGEALLRAIKETT